MNLRRLFVGVLVLTALTVLIWCRTGGSQAQARPADNSYVHHVETTDEEVSGGNRDEQAHRYRTNQPRHWRHVMIGSR